MIEQGQIWWVEQPERKRRPALVLTRPRSIERLYDVLLAPLTTTVRGLPTEVVVGAQDGVPRHSAVDLQHVMTVPKTYLRAQLGALAPGRWHEVCEAMRVAIDC